MRATLRCSAEAATFACQRLCPQEVRVIREGSKYVQFKVIVEASNNSVFFFFACACVRARAVVVGKLGVTKAFRVFPNWELKEGGDPPIML